VELIDVLTTFPNRYASFSEQTTEMENDGVLHIKRFNTPAHQSGMRDQTAAFYHYARSVWQSIKDKQYDLVFATSSRLATATLGALVARRLGAPLYLDIRDIFTDTLTDLAAGRPLALIIPMLRMVERWTFKNATKVNLVSEGFKYYFQGILPDQVFSFFPNGVDDEFIGQDFHKPKSEDLITILYAGNIGAGQGLHSILPKAASMLGEHYKLVVVGDGGMRQQLVKESRKQGVHNLEIHDPVPRTRLLKMYQETDYLLIHLNDYPAFHKVLPSKLFEYGATGKPILAGVAGFAREFVKQEIIHSALFDPCDAVGMVEAVHNLSPAETDRHDFVSRYSRQSIVARMVDDILSLE